MNMSMHTNLVKQRASIVLRMLRALKENVSVRMDITVMDKTAHTTVAVDKCGTVKPVIKLVPQMSVSNSITLLVPK